MHQAPVDHAASALTTAAPRPRLSVIAGAVAAAVCLAASAWLSVTDPPAVPVPTPLPDIHARASTPMTMAGRGRELAAAAAAALKPLGSAVDVIVRRNDTLDGIFRRMSVSIEDLAAVRSLPGVRQSLDFLKPGDVVKLSSLNGGLTSLTRRLNDTQTLTVKRALDGAFAADIVKNSLEIRTAPLDGRITSSLFKTVNDLGASDQVALQLSEVFRYDIDFAEELQPGDSFKMVLEKVWRDGRFLRDGDILAAEFTNNGHVYRAVRYTLPDGHHEFYTPDGRALKKAFLLAPLQFSRISSGFGTRWHPILNRMGQHKGIDYAAPTGTPIRAAGDGRIEFRGQKGGYGNAVMLAHSGGIETLYGHMSAIASNLFVGKRVKQGEVIGYVGMSGLATGPHLHYEYRVGGVHRNPASIKTLPAEPITPTLRADFLAKTAPLLASLEGTVAPVVSARAASAP